MEGIDNQNFITGGRSNRLSPSGFFHFVFNFDSDNKAVLLNMFQYILIALIPVVLILKFVRAAC